MAYDREYYSYIRNFFHHVAPVYDLTNIVLGRYREKVAGLVGPGNGLMILDVATGTGKQAFEFAKRGHDVVGIDLSRDMLDVARKNNSYDNLSLQISDASNLPFRDNAFDVCCVSFGLHEMPQDIMEQVIEEMGRVTKNGGIVLVVDHALPDNRVWGFVVYLYTKLYESKYYPAFIKADLISILWSRGIEIKDEYRFLLSSMRILKGINRKVIE